MSHFFRLRYLDISGEYQGNIQVANYTPDQIYLGFSNGNVNGVISRNGTPQIYLTGTYNKESGSIFLKQIVIPPTPALIIDGLVSSTSIPGKKIDINGTIWTNIGNLNVSATLTVLP
ncbi:hypothetical protein [Bacillus cereus group sp. BfR-BA-01441]|uniref:hypothetical protein n=1 Tax=Bacillus cereus group sp. BfR-BA-01441 TaxID=2920348 RepID=UPI001F573A51